MNPWLRRLLILLVVAAAVALAFGAGLVDLVRDEERLREAVESAGVLGPLLFVALMVLLVPLNVPGVLFVLPATTMFGTVGGIVLSLIGGFLASCVGVVGARRLGRRAFDARLSPRMRRVEAWLSARGFLGVALLRSFTFLLQPADWLCGLSSIPMRTVLAGTFVGLIPPTLFIAITGGALVG